MDVILTDVEVRILGCLMEKEMATPEYYPLSLNALQAACNQKSNRYPVVSYDEETIIRGLQELQERKVVRRSDASRVAKYEQIFSKKLNLLAREAAVISVLLVRGPQTLGEIRTRSGRLFQFEDLEDVQKTVSSLEEASLVTRLAKQPGRKESRYAHLLSGEITEKSIDSSPAPPSTIVRRGSDDRVDMQKQIDELRQELEALRQEFSAFKSQFD